MNIAHLVGNIFSLSQTFIINQLTGLIDEGAEPDLYTRFEHCESDVHEDVKSYQLKERTCSANIPSNIVLRILFAFPVFFLNVFRHPIYVLKSINGWKYGLQAWGTNLLYWTVAILNANDGRAEYDVVHCHFGHRGNIGVFLRDIGVISGKIVTTFYGQDVSELPDTFGENFYDTLFEQGDRFLVLSNHMKQRLIDLGASEERIKIHPLGIDTNRYKPSDTNSTPNNHLTVLSVGRLVQKKGFDNALRAVAQVRNETDCPEFNYIIAGDGPLRDKLEERIEVEHLDNVRLSGWKTRSEIKELYNGADLFLAPSVTSDRGDQEGTPTVIYEAMSMALPVVATRHAGIPEQVVDGETGYLVEEHAIDSLSDKLSSLLQDPEKRTRFGKNGRNRVREHFDIRKLVRQLLSLYRSLHESRDE